MTHRPRKSLSARKACRRIFLWHARSISDVPSTRPRPTRESEATVPAPVPASRRSDHFWVGHDPGTIARVTWRTISVFPTIRPVVHRWGSANNVDEGFQACDQEFHCAAAGSFARNSFAVVTSGRPGSASSRVSGIVDSADGPWPCRRLPAPLERCRRWPWGAPDYVLEFEQIV